VSDGHFQTGKMLDAQMDGADSEGKSQRKYEGNLNETVTTAGLIEPFQLPADLTLS
jgi:hypothetical protein